MQAKKEAWRSTSLQCSGTTTWNQEGCEPLLVRVWGQGRNVPERKPTRHRKDMLKKAILRASAPLR